jgi:hypothetical protein
MPRLKRFDIKKLLENPDLRRRLVVNSTIATQAREGIDVTKAEAENSYYVVTEGERAAFFGLTSFRTEAGENDGRHVCFVKQINEAAEEVRIDITLADFSAISASPLAFDKIGLVSNLFRYNPPLDPTAAIVRQGKATGDDGQWVRCHWELAEIMEWVPFAKGGEFCRFYSNVYLLLDWRERNRDALKSSGNALPSLEHYFKPGLTYPLRTNKGFNVRILQEGCVFGHKGPAIFPNSLADQHLLNGILNSSLCQYLISCLTSYSWEVGVVKRLPIAHGTEAEHQIVSLLAKELYSKKFIWDSGNEICTRFDRPWVLQTSINGEAATLSAALDAVLDHEAALDLELEITYAQLNDAVYRLYGVNDKLKAKLEAAIGQRPPEIVWPQMENKDRDQKRREHVDRLLCYLVKRIVGADEDGLVCFESVAHEPPLLTRLRKELSACFPQQDPSTLETEVVNELKKKTKGYRRAETLTEWLQDAFFDTHTSLYQQRPLIWHLASHQTRRVPAIGVLVHAHKFNADALAKLRGTHLRDRLATLRREAGQASQDGREDDRLEALAAIEELEAYDAKLKHLQDGHHTGPEGGERDYRILTPWKSAAERPQGWNPDLDDGIKVNIAPLARTNLLRRKLRFAEAEKDD